jgi:hypothetical protein
MMNMETPRETARLEFYLPGRRHFTLATRGGWLRFTREVTGRSVRR